MGERVYQRENEGPNPKRKKKAPDGELKRKEGAKALTGRIDNPILGVPQRERN